MRKGLLTIGMLVLLVVGGCGSDSSSSSSTGDSSTASSAPFRIPNPGGKRPTRYEKEVKVSSSGLAGSEPKPVIPSKPPPESLVVADLIEGIGHLVLEGQKVSVQYVGYDYETGKKFASSWDEGKPLTFTLGAGEVIQGWEEGLQGMEVGDRRELVVPPELAQGPAPPGIPQGQTVVFVVEALPPGTAANRSPSRSAPAK